MAEVRTVRLRWIAVGAWATLLVVFAIDAVTPQNFVVAILLDVPIVLSTLARSRRLTWSLVWSGLATDALAAFVDAAREGGGFDPIGVGDRLLSMTSIVLVGYLSTAVQERAQKVGRIDAEFALVQRDAQLGASIDRIRETLSRELVIERIVSEAVALFDLDGARYVSTDARESTRTVMRGKDGVRTEQAVLSAEIASLARRAIDYRDLLTIAHDEPLGGLVLDTVGSRFGFAIPIDPGDASPAIVFAWCREPLSARDRILGRAFGNAAATALAQASLFAELAERNEALSHRTAVVRDLVYALSHDVRTPLVALTMTLRQAETGAYGPLPESYRTVVRSSITAIDDLSRLADTLLAVARYDTEDHERAEGPIDLSSIVSDLFVELSALAAQRSIALAVTASRPVVIAGDRGDLRRAIANVIVNALEHASDAGRVDVDVRSQDTDAIVSVEDDGAGVNAQQRAALFERFESARTGRGLGTGLGLYIARRIVEEHGGTIAYEPRLPTGSLFRMTFKATAA